MNQEEFNKRVGENLNKYRKFNNFTQLQIAEKLNYSDKAVSKWENGECLPDVYVIKQLADIYGVTVNDLITPRSKPKASFSKINSFFVPLLSCCIVWLVALFAFFILDSTLKGFTKPWLVFIMAIPASAIITLVFSCIYKNRYVQLISITVIIWTVILSFHLALVDIFSEITTLYFVGIPLQVAALIWYLYRHIVRRKLKNKN